LWWPVKYERVYRQAHDSVAATRSGIGKFFEFYTCQRPRTIPDCLTPDHAIIESQLLAAAA
jgi:hypothetical protein